MRVMAGDAMAWNFQVIGLTGKRSRINVSDVGSKERHVSVRSIIAMVIIATTIRAIWKRFARTVIDLSRIRTRNQAHNG